MNQLLHTVSKLLPDNAIKDQIRKTIFPLLFFSIGSKEVEIGPPQDKTTCRIAHFPFYGERLGEREIEGYLKYYQPKNGDIAINAGGYHGYFSLYLANKVGSEGRVICFEPDPINYKIIKKNIAYNKIKNITVINKGLWDRITTLPFETRGSSSRISGSSAARQIEATSLDHEVNQLNLPRVDYISMDIEGAELEAIEGMQDTIRQNPDISLAIASYHIRDDQKTAPTVERKLSDLGLSTETGFPRHLTTYAAKTL